MDKLVKNSAKMLYSILFIEVESNLVSLYIKRGWKGDGKWVDRGWKVYERGGGDEDIGGQTERKGRLGSERDIIYIL